jgi:hypothetical protein
MESAKTCKKGLKIYIQEHIDHQDHFGCRYDKSLNSSTVQPESTHGFTYVSVHMYLSYVCIICVIYERFIPVIRELYLDPRGDGVVCIGSCAGWRNVVGG